MAFPIGTKVYLENKTLKNIEDLQFGDKVLSIKTKDSETLNYSEFYHKYIKLDDQKGGPSIKTEDIVFCSATVYSVHIYKDFTNFKSLNNSAISPVAPILIQKNLEADHLYLKNADSIIAKLSSNPQPPATPADTYFIDSLLTEPFKEGNGVFYSPDSLFLQTKIDNFNLNFSNKILVCLTLLDNFFFFTEEFICFNNVLMQEELT
jgi:hypothetical protein